MSSDVIDAPATEEATHAKKKGRGRSDGPFKPSEKDVRQIPIKEILSNSQNPRESAPQLIGLGYGLFEKQPGSDKSAIVPLALSDKLEDKAEFVKIIEKWEPTVAELAADILVNGMIHPITVRHVPGENVGYDLVVGCRRTLAVLYNHCKTSSPRLPANVPAIVREVSDGQSEYMAFSENAHRLHMSPIEQAKWFARMKNGGMKISDIAAHTKVNDQVIKQRLELLKLDEKDQQRVHEGELGVVKAVQMVKSKSDTKGGSSGGGSATGKGHRGDGSRRKAPSIKDFEKMYSERVDLDEKVREFIALEILEVTYLSFKKLQAEKKKVEEAAAAAGKK